VKYMAMFTRADWEDTAPEAERQRRYDAIGEWWGRLAAQGKIVEGHQLQPPHTATTVVLNGDHPQVIDGPFMEAKETIGGYGIFEVADLDEAMALVRSFPSPTGRVEVRPVIER
jgi:hypothetical protein